MWKIWHSFLSQFSYHKTLDSRSYLNYLPLMSNAISNADKLCMLETMQASLCLTLQATLESKASPERRKELADALEDVNRAIARLEEKVGQ